MRPSMSMSANGVVAKVEFSLSGIVITIDGGHYAVASVRSDKVETEVVLEPVKSPAA